MVFEWHGWFSGWKPPENFRWWQVYIINNIYLVLTDICSLYDNNCKPFSIEFETTILGTKNVIQQTDAYIIDRQCHRYDTFVKFYQRKKKETRFKNQLLYVMGLMQLSRWPSRSLIRLGVDTGYAGYPKNWVRLRLVVSSLGSSGCESPTVYRTWWGRGGGLGEKLISWPGQTIGLVHDTQHQETFDQ